MKTTIKNLIYPFMRTVRFQLSSRGRQGVLLLSVLLLTSQALSGAAVALSPGQKQLFDVGVSNFNLQADQTCSASSSGGGASGTGAVTSDLASFVDAYGQFAFDVGKANGIPYDAILTQASWESNFGQSGLNQQANNFFGIKAYPGWTGPTITLPTHEEVNGQLITVNAQFVAFSSPQAGFQGYVDFLKRNPRYTNAGVFNHQHDPIGYFQALKDAGYATDSTYVTKLTGRLTGIQNYIASKGVLPPESQVTYDVAPVTGGGAGGSTPAGSAAGGGSGCTLVAGASGNASGVVAVALGEIGNNYVKYTNGRIENWCADFVSWVFKSAGKPFVPTPGVPMSDGWQIPSVDGVRTYLETKGQFFLKSSTAPAPQPGDIVIYKNGMSHTNIVVEANGYMVKTVGGNQESNSVTSSVVSESKGAFDIRNDSTVTGWGRLP
jgi:hypothetical protein